MLPIIITMHKRSHTCHRRHTPCSMHHPLPKQSHVNQTPYVKLHTTPYTNHIPYLFPHTPFLTPPTRSHSYHTMQTPY
ncbi:hypothetical protein EON63_14985 [archaeon]|nr:MAG: hypothetical protein EON63_14985 [archaeon]